jgi:hypothetical protein
VNTPEPTRTRTANRLMLLLIFGIFVLPIVVAWLLTSGRLGWKPAVLVNHGTLLNPPVDLAQLPHAPGSLPLREMPPADWAVIYVGDGACDDSCRALLRELSAIRLVIGQQGTRVSVFGLFAAEQPPMPERQLVDPDLLAALRAAFAARPDGGAPPFVAFVDWRGQLMMHFPTTAPPTDIKSDLKRLLSASAIK